MQSNITTPLMRGTILAAGLSLLACLFAGTPAQAETKLPPVEEVLRDMKITPDELQRVKEGAIVDRSIGEGSERELAISFILLAKIKLEDAAKLYREARGLQTVKAIKSITKISENGTLADFEKAVLQPNPDKEAKRYLDAEPGSTLNLDEKEIAAFQALKSASKGKASVKDVEQLVRQGLLDRFQAYRTKGLAGIAPYQRGRSAQLSVGDELRLSAKQSTYLAKYVPALHDVLMNYPAAKEKVKKEKFEESFYWFTIELFDRPTFVLSHRVAMFADYAYVAIERQYYASHDYNSMQQIAAALPTKDGTLLFYIARVSTDQVAGLTSAAAHPVARTVMAPYIKDMLEALRSHAGKK